MELFEARVRRVRAVLEALDASHPTFDMLPAPEGGGGFVSTALFYYQGMPVVIPLLSAAAKEGAVLSTVGRSKAEAEGFALLVATLCGGVLKGQVVPREMGRICNAISSLPMG